jgi:hypothetical protein
MGTVEMTSASMSLSLEPIWHPWSSGVNRPQSFAEMDQPSKGHVDPPVSVFGQAAAPAWLSSADYQLRQLGKLAPGWDHHGGRPMNKETLFFAWQFLNETLEASTPPPRIVPLSYGGIQAEWHEKDIDLEIEIERPFCIHVWFRDRRTRSELEEELEQDFSRLEEPVRVLSTR